MDIAILKETLDLYMEHQLHMGCTVFYIVHDDALMTMMMTKVKVPEEYEDNDPEALAYVECSLRPESQNSAPYQTRLQPTAGRKKFKFNI